MKKLSLACLLVATSLAFMLVAPGAAQELLTNDSALAMKKAGLSDQVILAKIRASQTKFEVSTPALIKLKEAGISDPIIEAMVTHAGPAGALPAPTTTAAVARGTSTPGALPSGRESIFHARGDQYVELAVAPSSMETSHAFYSTKSELVLSGRKAAYRVSETKPVFFSAFAPSELPLVKLKPGSDHDDRNLKISSGSFMPFGGSHKFGVRSEDKIDVDSEKDPRGFYRITPKKPLPPGEYGFILTQGFAAGAGKVYDFGVDEGR